MQAALTGHQIFTTLHTNDCPSTIRRLLDIGIASFLVNSTLTGVMTQRLVRKVCPDCREEYTPADWVLDGLELKGDVTFYRGKGCDKCRNTGFRGRTAIHELMGVDDDLRRLTAQDAGHDELRAQAVASGMVPLKQDGVAKAAEGITTIEEVMRVCG
jgi:type II secretory ATPase GspE/PulE/Tfp pilus assembly ATPase PilB-like protein